MIMNESNGIVWYQFSLLSDCKSLVHGVFTRKGGVSSRPFDSLNFSYSVGDQTESVTTNTDSALKCLSLTKMCKPKICHGDNVLSVEDMEREKQGSDGVMTTRKNIGLVITHADCQAAIFYDPITKSLAAVHCGWRGNVLNIYKKTVLLMKSKYGVKSENLLVGISPSLGPSHAEFKNYKRELPKYFLDYKSEKCHFDFWNISRLQLIESGVLPHHIECAKMCTYSMPEHFFSYRREQVCGRNGTIAAIRK